MHPGDPDVVDVAREALDRYGFKGFKFHINVQRFHPDDPRILPVYELLLARGAVLLIHVGSAPWPNEYDGFPRFERVMTMFPELKVIVAHMGQFETRRHLELMGRCPNMYLDTTAAMAPQSAIYREAHGASAADVTDADLVRWQDRILFGSDFPNTPHTLRRRAAADLGAAGARDGSPQDLPRQRPAPARSLVRVGLEQFPESARRALAALVELAGPREAGWVVGGTLRELLSGGAAADLDLAVAGGALELGRRLADRLDASFVVLDEARGAGRIVPRAGGAVVDLVDLRAATLEADLRARDFTVNALAAPVDGAAARRRRRRSWTRRGGLDDLRDRVVRPCGPAAIGDDPVRALRGVRLALRPGWRLHPDAEAAIQAAAPLLARVAPERIRDELIGILAEPAAAAGLRTLDRLGVLAVLLPESLPMRATAQPLPHHFDVWEHSLRAVEGDGRVACRARRARAVGAGPARASDAGPGRWAHPAGSAEAGRAAPRRGQARDADGRGRAHPFHRPRRGRRAPRRRRSPGASVSRGTPRRCSSGSWPSTCGPCIWRRRGSSPGARASASSGRSATRRAICCCWRWPTRPRSTAPRRWRSGRAPAATWCAR